MGALNEKIEEINEQKNCFDDKLNEMNVKLIPVSYTHLDVYKRQAYHSDRCRSPG